MRRSIRVVFSTLLLCISVALPLCAATNVERTGPISVEGTPDDIKKALENQGYRVTLDDGWTAEFWFSRGLTPATNGSAGSLYPDLANGEFVGVVNFPKGSSDFRGQAIAAGTYTLRYQNIPQDANHMGVSPNPDFLLAIPIASDGSPGDNLPLARMVKLSAKATGTAHPAVISLAPAGAAPGATKDEQGMTILTEPVSTAPGKTLNVGIVIKGQANQ